MVVDHFGDGLSQEEVEVDVVFARQVRGYYVDMGILRTESH